MNKSYLPDSITLPDGTVLKPVIGGHLDQKPFLTVKHSGVDVTQNGWLDQTTSRYETLVVNEARRQKLKYRRVTVQNRQLRGKLDLHGRPYQGSAWVFVEVPRA